MSDDDTCEHCGQDPAICEHGQADVADVLQAPPTAVPVSIDGPVRVDALPTIIGEFKKVELPLDGRAVKVAHGNRKRARLTFWATGDDVQLGQDQAQADMFVGPILSGGLGVPYHFGFSDEVWARTADTATTAATLNVAEELWSR